MKITQTNPKQAAYIKYRNLKTGQEFYHTDIGLCLKTDQLYSISLADGCRRSLSPNDIVQLVSAEVTYKLLY